MKIRPIQNSYKHVKNETNREYSANTQKFIVFG